MPSTPEISAVAGLIRRLRAEAGLTQRELAERVGTTQSVISRLESDDYQGHSLSMLYRIGAALDRRIAVTAGKLTPAVVGEHQRAYEAKRSSEHPDSPAGPDGLSPAEIERMIERLERRFRHRGLTRADIDESIRWARGHPGRGVAELRGIVAVGPGDAVDDVRRAREQRGREVRP